MLSLLQRFAQVLVTKLNKLAREYTVVRADETTETVVQTVARRATAWLLEQFIKVINHLPMHSAVSGNVRDDLDRLAHSLWGVDPSHLSMNGVP